MSEKVKRLLLGKTGKVNLLESQTLVTRSGEKATTESVTEFIYPSQYSPAYSGGEWEKNKKNYIYPTGFQTQNLGATLEIEPILGADGKSIDVSFRPEICYHVGETFWGKDARVTYKMPTIYTLRVNTSFTLTNGKFHFVSALTPKDENGKADPTKKILIFVKADILTAGQ